MGATVAGGSDIYLFVDPTGSIKQVRFWLGRRRGTPYHVDKVAPFDLAGSAPDGSAQPFTVPDAPGPFVVSVEVTFTNGSVQNTKVTLQLT